MLSSSDIIRALKKLGFIEKSQKGSHLKLVSGSKTVIVPHPKKSVPMGTFMSIVRQSGLNKADFYDG